jgi:predicted signal transduction protein with EAL and GGDEF domain
VKEGSIRGWVGVGVGVEDFGAGAAHLPKFVVLPLKALMLKDNFASGAVSAAAEKSWVKGIL